MPLEGEYEPSSAPWVREQVEEYERSGGQRANTLLDTGWPIIIVTTRGNRSGKLRKFGLMRVEHDGEYALVASKGGAPENPLWYHNLKAVSYTHLDVYKRQGEAIRLTRWRWPCGLALWVGAGRACEGLSVGWVRAWLPMGHTCQVAEAQTQSLAYRRAKLHANPPFPCRLLQLITSSARALGSSFRFPA